MSLECGCDGDGLYVEVPETLSVCSGTLICGECHQLIHAGTPYYRAWTWGYDEYGDEFDREIHEVCEPCGDLAIAILERGFCWTFGELLDDIETLHGLETRQK